MLNNSKFLSPSGAAMIEAVLTFPLFLGILLGFVLTAIGFTELGAITRDVVYTQMAATADVNSNLNHVNNVVIKDLFIQHSTSPIDYQTLAYNRAINKKHFNRKVNADVARVNYVAELALERRYAYGETRRNEKRAQIWAEIVLPQFNPGGGGSGRGGGPGQGNTGPISGYDLNSGFFIKVEPWGSWRSWVGNPLRARFVSQNSVAVDSIDSYGILLR